MTNVSPLKRNIAITLIAIFVFHIVTNLDPATFYVLWFMKFTMPLCVWLALSAALGAGMLWTFQLFRKKKDAVHEAETDEVPKADA